MPDGKLKLKLLDVYGKPIAERADVFMRNQTLSDTPIFRDLDGSKTNVLTNLNIFPNGRYSIEVDALSFHTVSQFVNIPPDGNGDLTVTLPVNPKKVIRVEFPAFAAVVSDARTLLNNSPKVLNFSGISGEALYNALDDIRRAGFLNLVAKADRTKFGTGRSVLSFIQELTELSGDRFFASVPAELRSETINSMHDDLFHEVSELLHTPPPGYTTARSFKTFDHYGNLQLSFFVDEAGNYAVDMDIDDAQGFDHVFQVIGNFFGGPTHPYNIHEILIADQELDPGYRLIVREAKTAKA